VPVPQNPARIQHKPATKPKRFSHPLGGFFISAIRALSNQQSAKTNRLITGKSAGATETRPCFITGRSAGATRNQAVSIQPSAFSQNTVSKTF
jgi:hypothetical protein